MPFLIGTKRALISGKRALWTPAAGFESGVLLSRWYDALDLSTLTIGSGLVSVAQDKGPNKKQIDNVPGGSARWPNYLATGRNGLPTIQHTITNRILTSADITNLPVAQQAMTVAIACYGMATMATFQGFMSMLGTGDAPFFQSSGAGTARYQSAAANMSDNNGISMINNDVNFVFACDAGAVVSAEISGNGDTPTTSGAFARAAYTIPVGISVGSSGTINWHWKEVIILAGRATRNDINRLHGYFAWKWKMVDKLAASFIYKSAPPFVH